MTPFRRVLALGALALLALSFAPFYRPRAIAARLRQDVSRDPGFAFDSRYREFLDALEARTPPTATLAILAPETSALYLEQAAYRLAPRRVVGKEHSADAPFLALYRPDKTPRVPEGGVAVPGGFLLKR